MESISEIWTAFWKRPIASTVTFLTVLICIHLPLAAIEHWINEQIAELLGITKPTLMEAINFIITWGVPFILAAVTMGVYHSTQPIPHKNNDDSSVPLDHSLPTRRDSLQWIILVSIVFVVFTLGEITIQKISTLQPGSPGPTGPAGPPGPPGPAGPPAAAAVASDPRIAQLIDQQQKLVSSMNVALMLRRYQQLQIDSEILVEMKSRLEGEIAQVETGIKSGNIMALAFGLGSGGPSVRQQLSAILKASFPDVNQNFMETPSELDIRTRSAPGEEALPNQDSKNQYRRYHLMAIETQIALDEATRRTTSELSVLRQTITNTPTPKGN